MGLRHPFWECPHQNASGGDVMEKESWSGHTTSDDLLCEHDEDVDTALKTGLVIPNEAEEKIEVEAETKEFGDDESAEEPGPNDQEYKP
jgi:hypothetical protein